MTYLLLFAFQPGGYQNLHYSWLWPQYCAGLLEEQLFQFLSSRGFEGSSCFPSLTEFPVPWLWYFHPAADFGEGDHRGPENDMALSRVVLAQNAISTLSLLEDP